MTTKDDQARRLAEMHYRMEEGITGIYRIVGGGTVEAEPDEPIKLLEANKNTVASGILPLRFGPTPAAGIHYPAVIVEVTPDELRHVRTGKLALPGGWKLTGLIPRPAANGEG
jgi:hypothetical protein